MHKPIEPKSIAYDYLFNYFGDNKFKGNIISGACLQIAIRAYKDGREIKFIEEPKYNNYYFDDIYQVSFDRERLYHIERRELIDNIFCLIYGWDEIKAEIIGYTLDYLDLPPVEILKDLPKPFCSLPSSTPQEVTEEEFRTFLINNIDEFDISDNINAQVPSISYI